MRRLLVLLCWIIAAASVGGMRSADTTHAASISPLITDYLPQVVSVDKEVSYVNDTGDTITATIRHPGIVMTADALDNMRDHVRAGNEPWNTAFQALANDQQARKNPRIFYEPGNDLFVNIRGPWAFTDDTGRHWPNPSEYVGSRANTDALIAFKQSIMWYVTGDESYRSSAMYIIRAYSGIESVHPHRNFRFATMSYLLAAAAEIMRYSDTETESLKWTDEDTAKLSNAMELVSVTYDPHSYFMNQHQFNVMGTMGRAIFTNDLELYALAVEAATVNALGEQGGMNGSIKQQLRWMTANEVTGEPLDPSDYHVQLMEMGRDAGHSYASLGGLMTLAQTIYAQGTTLDPVLGTMSNEADAVNVFHFLDERLLAGTTYILKYHLGYDVPWTTAYSGGTGYYDRINPDGRGRIDPYLSVLYNYYKYIEQQDMTLEKFKYLAYAYETKMPMVAAKDYPLVSLLFIPDAAQTDGLSNRIVLGEVADLTAEAIGSNTVALSWPAVPGTLGYNLYRATLPDGAYTKITSEPITELTYIDTELTPNTIYYYKVGVPSGTTSEAVPVTTGGDGVPALDATSYVLNVNHTHQVQLRVIHPDRSTQDLTSKAQYTSSNPSVASVDSNGLVTANTAGSSTIITSYNGETYVADILVVNDSSLHAWYQFDESSGATAADSSGFQRDGIVIGGEYAGWTAGKYGNAISFDGAGTDPAYVLLPANLVDSLEQMTFSAWVRASNTEQAVSLFTASPEAATVPVKYMMMLLNGSRFMITNNGNGAEQNIRQGSHLPANVWKHVAVTLSGNTGILYIDGQQAAINTGMTVKPSDLAPTTNGNFIGRSAWTGDRYLKGQIDDFRIYNRALSASEITAVMNGEELTTVNAPPTGVEMTTSGINSISLNWTAVPGATGYHVYYKDSLASNIPYTRATGEMVTGTSFTVTGLEAGTSYYLRVTAVNEAGESRMSATVDAYTGNDPNVGEPETDKSGLLATIESAQAMHDRAVEGTKLGQYAMGSKSALQTAIQAAWSVITNANATPDQVGQAIVALNFSFNTFKEQFISMVDGQTSITIRDLAIIAHYQGATADGANWSEISKADVLHQGRIDHATLAAVAKMILIDWLTEL